MSLSVCPLAELYQICLHVTCDLGSVTSDGVAIRYALPVLWMMPYLHTNGSIVRRVRQHNSRNYTASIPTTAAAPASEVEAVVRSPTNMAAAKIVAVDFNKMTSK